MGVRLSDTVSLMTQLQVGDEAGHVVLVREAVPPPAPSTTYLTMLGAPHHITSCLCMHNSASRYSHRYPWENSTQDQLSCMQTNTSILATGRGVTHMAGGLTLLREKDLVYNVRHTRLQGGAPVEVVVPGVLAVLLEDGQQLSVLHDELRVLARQRKPLAALAPVPPQLVPHAHPKAPRIRPLRRHQSLTQDTQVNRKTVEDIWTAFVDTQGPDTVLL